MDKEQELSHNWTKFYSLVKVYVDDNVIVTEATGDHLVISSDILDCVRAAGRKWKSKKCDFVREKTIFSRKIITEQRKISVQYTLKSSKLEQPPAK